jgi:hypothetical protein
MRNETLTSWVLGYLLGRSKGDLSTLRRVRRRVRKRLRPNENGRNLKSEVVTEAPAAPHPSKASDLRATAQARTSPEPPSVIILGHQKD